MPMRLVYLLTACFALPWAVFASEPMDSVIAIVGDEIITRSEVESELNVYREAGRNVEKNIVLENIIDYKLQLNQARFYNISVDVAQHLRDLRVDIEGDRGRKFTTEEAFIEYLTAEGDISEEQLREEIEAALLVQRLFQIEVLGQVQVTEKQVEDYILNETDFGLKQSYHIQFLRVDRADKSNEAEQAAADIDERLNFAQSLKDRLQAENNLNALASAVSTDKFLVIDSDLGLRFFDNLPPKFVEAVQNLKPGQVTDALTTEQGVFILKLVSSSGGKIRDSIRNLQLAHVFLPLNEEAVAKEALQAVKNNSLSFEQAVRQYSTDENSVNNGGLLGWFVADQLPEFFKLPVEQLKVGEVSDLIKTPYGFHLVKLLQDEETKIDLQSVRREAVQVLRQRNALSARESWLRELREKTEVSILDASFLSP